MWRRRINVLLRRLSRETERKQILSDIEAWPSGMSSFGERSHALYGCGEKDERHVRLDVNLLKAKER
jgi:hypothetical protein